LPVVLKLENDFFHPRRLINFKKPAQRLGSDVLNAPLFIAASLCGAAPERSDCDVCKQREISDDKSIPRWARDADAGAEAAERGARVPHPARAADAVRE
jgi:hypothetical protein